MTTHTSDSELFWIRRLSAEALDDERKIVLRCLLDAVPFASVMEVGSTALDDVVGKQDLDFAVRVSAQEFERARSVLDSLLQRNDNQLYNSEYQGYVVASPLDVAVQLFVAGGEHDTFERFVVVLRARPDLRRAYNTLKHEWKGRAMTGYRLAKQAFIESALKGPQLPAASANQTNEKS